MELPGGAVNVHPANNAYARIGRAGPGLAGPGKSSPSSRPANKPSVTPRALWVRDRLWQPHDHPDFSNLEAVTGYDGAARVPRKNGANQLEKMQCVRSWHYAF
jgi:hypothetical protein